MDGAVIKSADEINNLRHWRRLQMISRLRKMTLELTVHLLPQALILPVTGASRHTLQTFQSIMSTKKTESHPQMRSKEPILITSRTCLTFISQILLWAKPSFQQDYRWCKCWIWPWRGCVLSEWNLAYDSIKDNEVADEDMGMLPIYIWCRWWRGPGTLHRQWELLVRK